MAKFYEQWIERIVMLVVVIAIVLMITGRIG